MDLSTAYQSSHTITELFTNQPTDILKISTTKELVKSVPINEMVTKLGFGIAYEKLPFIGFFQANTKIFIINSLDSINRQRFSLAKLLIEVLKPEANDSEITHLAIELLFPKPLVELAVKETIIDMDSMADTVSFTEEQLSIFLALISEKLSLSSTAARLRLEQLDILV